MTITNVEGLAQIPTSLSIVGLISLSPFEPWLIESVGRLL